MIPRVAEVQATNIPFAKPEICEEAIEAAQRVLRSGWLTTGPEVAEFEREFAERIGARHAVAVSSCTAAIELSLRALHLEPGSKVLTSTMTFCGAVHAIVHAGLEPVLVDVNPHTLMPDPSTVLAAIRRVGCVDAMVIVHMAGHPAPVSALASAAGLSLDKVVEDAAHGLGTWVENQPVGSISAATAFSFYVTKNLPIGEGGMVTTNDDRMAAEIRRSRLHGMSHDAWKRHMPGANWHYTVEASGLKANMTDLQAAIGRAQLARFDEWQASREELADLYDEGLAGVPGISLPLRPSRGRHAWHLYIVHLEREFGMYRDEFIVRLSEAGIDCSVHFIPVHIQPYFLRTLRNFSVGDFPGADSVSWRLVSLPFYPALGAEGVACVTETIARLAAAPPRHIALARNNLASSSGVARGATR